MIDTDEVVNKAEELGVHPYNVQRDYIFGWVLAGIYTANDLGKYLVLKGGNCFRKAYFEAARYSPDWILLQPKSFLRNIFATNLLRYVNL